MGTVGMFWGLKIKPGCRYESEVEESFRITKACLAPSKEEGMSSVFIQTNKEEQSFMIACLGPNNLSECVDVSFSQGQRVCFKVEGKSIVHLTGNVVHDLDEDSDSESMESEESSSEEDESEMGELSHDDESEMEEVSEDYTVNKIKEEVTNKSKLHNKIKVEEKNCTKNKHIKKELEISKEKVQKSNSNKSSSGMKVEDIVIGSGSECKRGNGIGMYYTGYLLKSGKVFDSVTSGRPFKFKLGHNQVIKGWDVGVEGMRVGGKRKLTIPASMGYGGQGAPPTIPGNADLVFSVECKFVKVYGGNQDW